MNYKISNRVFLWTLVINSFFDVLLEIIIKYFLPQGVEISMAAKEMLTMFVILIPSAAALITCRGSESPGEVLPFHRFRLSSALVLVLVVILIQPISSLLNLVSQKISPNIISESVETTSSGGMPVMLLFVFIIIAPIVEEVIFRGVIFHGLGNSCGFLTAAILTSLFFGLYHMNFNQFIYTIVLGFFLAMAVQATGSLLASILMHLIFNFLGSSAVITILSAIPDRFSHLLINEAGDLTGGFYVFLLVLAVIFTPLAVIAVRWIAKNEGRRDALVFRKEKGTEEKSVRNFVTPSMVIGVVLSAATIILLILFY